MYVQLRKAATSMLAVIGVMALFWAGDSSDAQAQTFEHTYGATCSEAGRGGVQPVTNGRGYVAVGESFSSSQCAGSDVYIIRTNTDGTPAWTKTYDIGGNDSATDIQEVMIDPAGWGGFIITGVTENRNSERCRPSRDLFLLRVDGCGNLLWLRTYGTYETEEIGWDVLEAQTGTEEYGTRAGDFVAAGSTTYPSGCGRNGYLLRVDPWGNFIWDAYYDGPKGRDDYFYSLDECLSNNAGSTGDIVAGGGSNSYFTNSYDAWIVRVDGNTGGNNGFPNGAAAYGGDGFEELRSVVELKNSNYQGSLVGVGRSNSGLANYDAFLMQTGPYPCEGYSFRLVGDFGRNPDEAYCVREVPFDFGENVYQGALIVTGYMTPDYGIGHGGKDLFLQLFEPGSLNPITGYAMLYGTPGTDWGWSVSPVCNSNDPERCRELVAEGCMSLGFVAAGFTPNRYDPNDPQQLYLLKTDIDLEDNCTAIPYYASYQETHFDIQCAEVYNNPIREQCEKWVEWQCLFGHQEICIYFPKGTYACAADGCDECRHENQQRSSGSDKMVSGSAFAVSSYPNPVKSGSTLSVDYTLQNSGDMTIIINDISGKVLHTASIHAQAGRGVEEISTSKWPAGSYIVTVKAEGMTKTRRVVVVD